MGVRELEGGFGAVAVAAGIPFSFVSEAWLGAAGRGAAGNSGEGPDGFSFFPSFA